MNESRLMELVSSGEGKSVDFKRIVNLESARDKAEFVKDSISIANSVDNVGFLVVGVEDDGHIVGTSLVIEDQIQQILHTYVDPPLSVRCHVIQFPLENKVVSVVEISPTKKPHKVSRDLDRLTQNEVFVRHGSVVHKASPDEIFHMRDHNADIQRQIAYHSSRGDAFARVAQWEKAIEAFSMAIELMPSSGLFTLRGQTYIKLWESEVPTQERYRLRKSAYEDFYAALRLATNLDEEKAARFGRLETCSKTAEFEEDVAWLKQHCSGADYGSIIVQEVASNDAHIFRESAPWAIEELTKALDLGYQEPKAFCARAKAYAAVGNYGLALSDINVAISMLDKHSRTIVECLCLRANIQQYLGAFEDAYEDLLTAQLISPEEFELHVNLKKSRALITQLLINHLLVSSFQDDAFEDVSEIVRLVVLGNSSVPSQIQISAREKFDAERHLDRQFLSEFPRGLIAKLNEIVNRGDTI